MSINLQNQIQDQHKYRELLAGRSVYTGKRVSIFAKYDEDCEAFGYVLFVDGEVSGIPSFDYGFIREQYGQHI